MKQHMIVGTAATLHHYSVRCNALPKVKGLSLSHLSHPWFTFAAGSFVGAYFMMFRNTLQPIVTLVRHKLQGDPAYVRYRIHQECGVYKQQMSPY